MTTLQVEALELSNKLARLSWDQKLPRAYWWRVNELAHRALSRSLRRLRKGV